ncbi:MAG: hypothetical protein Kow0022_08810 [Phycisphaerales bacterium]
MKKFAALMCVLGWSAAALGQPINRYCPVGQEPIDKSTPTIKYHGHEIGFCCPGCDDKFLSWDEKRRDEFVQLALAGKEPHGKDVEPQTDSKPATATDDGYPYPLAVCPISGESLDHEGAPVVRKIEGREVKFCCDDCAEKFASDPARYFEKLDQQIIEQQAIHYPLNTCIVSGEPMVEDGKFTGVNVVYKNRLVRFCCDRCAEKFSRNPAPIIAKLDQAMIEQLRATYPLNTCIVSGEELGGMGEPVERLYMNRLVRFCCEKCAGKFEKDLPASMAKLDAAFADALRPRANTVCPVSGEDLDDDAVEVVVGQKLVRFCCKKCASKFKAQPEQYLER